MTQANTTSYNLSVSKVDPVTQQVDSSLNLNTTDAEHLLRLLALCGQGQDAGKKYNLYITNTQQASALGSNVSGTMSTNIQSDSAESLARLLSLAGMGSHEDAEPECACQTQEGGMSVPPVDLPMPMMEQQAAYDYGHKDPTEEQEEFSITDYNFRGRADLPERLTSARFGSNALKDDMKESAFDAMRSKYLDFLNESRENEGGEASPLTANARDEFNQDPLAGEKVVDDGSRSPLSRIERPDLKK